MSLKSVNNVAANKYELAIEISAEDFENALQKAYLKARKNISIPGFRKGKAPRKIIERTYGESVFFEDAVNAIYAPEVNNAITESKLEIVAQPKVDVEDISKENGVKIKATVVTKPEVEIEGYKGIEVTKTVNAVTDEDVARVEPGYYDYVLTHCCPSHIFNEYQAYLCTVTNTQDNNNHPDWHISENKLEQVYQFIDFGKWCFRSLSHRLRPRR